MPTLRGALTDSAILTWRNAIRISRVPDLLVFTTIQPVLFVVLFAYVFGDAITVPGSDYRAYLMPGVIVQSAVWVSAITAIGLADDVRRGIGAQLMARHRSRNSVSQPSTCSSSCRYGSSGPSRRSMPESIPSAHQIVSSTSAYSRVCIARVAQRSTSSRDWPPLRMAVNRTSTSARLGGVGWPIVTTTILPSGARFCRPRTVLSWPNALAHTPKIIAHILYGRRQVAAFSDLHLHICANRGAYVLSAQVVFSLIFEVPPAGIEPATHGLGNRCSIP